MLVSRVLALNCHLHLFVFFYTLASNFNAFYRLTPKYLAVLNCNPKLYNTDSQRIQYLAGLCNSPLVLGPLELPVNSIAAPKLNLNKLGDLNVCTNCILDLYGNNQIRRKIVYSQD